MNATMTMIAGTTTGEWSSPFPQPVPPGMLRDPWTTFSSLSHAILRDPARPRAPGVREAIPRSRVRNLDQCQKGHPRGAAPPQASRAPSGSRRRPGASGPPFRVPGWPANATGSFAAAHASSRAPPQVAALDGAGTASYLSGTIPREYPDGSLAFSATPLSTGPRRTPFAGGQR